jgi:hypothetical protein
MRAYLFKRRPMIRVMLTHPMPLVSQALVKRFSQEPEFQIVGCATTTAELLATLPRRSGFV